MAKAVKQAHLDGMAPPSIAEIDEAAEAYVKVRNARMRALEREVEARDALQRLMKDHELEVYEFEDKRVEIVAAEKVKVRKIGEDTGESEEE